MNIKKAPIYSMKNRSELKSSESCGCFNCLNMFKPENISNWTDDGETALCPHCERDMVLANISEEDLNEAHKLWIPENRPT